MDIFISYSSRDTDAASKIADDLIHAGYPSWLDRELGGGEAWWQTILERIRTCKVFVFALSDNSIRSQPCQAELKYANGLNLPIIPVQVGPFRNVLTAPISERQIIDYRERTATAGIRLVTAITRSATNRAPLPDRLPEPPPTPFAYLLQAAKTISKADLQSADQVTVISQLRNALLHEDDDRAQANTIDLLWQLRHHPDCTHINAQEIDQILGDASRLSGRNQVTAGATAAPQPPGPTSGSGRTRETTDRPTRRRVLVGTARGLALLTAGGTAGWLVGRQSTGSAGLTVVTTGRAVLGIKVSDADEGAGALIADVSPGGPADRVGVEPGDVVAAVEDRPVESASDLIAALVTRAPGDVVDLELGDRSVRVTLASEAEFPITPEATPTTTTQR